MFTTHGFVSVVQHDVHRGFVLVRARELAHLEELKSRTGLPGKIEHTPTHDYYYRMLVRKPLWADAVRDLAMQINYGNFKQETSLRQGKHSKYSVVLHQVWALLRGASK